MIVLAPVPCGECGEIVYVSAERAIEIVEDDTTLECGGHT